MFISTDDHLDHILTEEGRMKWDDHDSLFYAEYFIKDHLGNVRTVLTTNPNFNWLAQQTDYYPFGQEIPLDGISNNQLKYNGKELQDEAKLGWYDYGARFYDPVLGRWHSVDPLAEKFESWSVYQYVRNNPILRIDPNGMDDYTINKKTGDVSLVRETDDKTDRVVKTYSMGEHKGEVKYNKKGEVKTAFGGVEKGILSNGMNFQENDNIIEVGGEGQATVDGVKSFTLQLSEYVGKEIKGFSYSSNGSGNATDMSLGKYKYNEFTKSYGTPNALQKKYGANFSFNNVTQQFHTHPNGELGATQSAPGQSADVRALQYDKPFIPNASFIIWYRVAGQVKPGEYEYTHEFKP